MKRETVMLAHTYDPSKHCVAGWFVSEKLDGVRCLWDGGLTRGMPANAVPFANTAKDHIRVNEVFCTGLWSRYFHPIQAPDWWLNALPVGVPLDGELYIGPGQFQRVVSITKTLDNTKTNADGITNDERWNEIKYSVFDLPSYQRMFMDGTINNPNFKNKDINFNACNSVLELSKLGTGFVRNFFEVVDATTNMFEGDVCTTLWQERLPPTVDSAKDRMDEMMDLVLAKGGEGLILRNPSSIWTPKRTWDLLKVKPENDSEAIVVDYVWGKGKLTGLMGAMVVAWEGKKFELSGFRESERELVPPWSGNVGGKLVDKSITSTLFPRGSTVTFKYRELTDAGIPKEARYYRKG